MGVQLCSNLWRKPLKLTSMRSMHSYKWCYTPGVSPYIHCNCLCILFLLTQKQYGWGEGYGGGDEKLLLGSGGW